MRRVKVSLTEKLAESFRSSKPEDIARANPFLVSSFTDLLSQVAQLSYLNKDYLLFYRGQRNDYKNKVGASSFYPTIYRSEGLSKESLILSFIRLSNAAAELCKILESEGIKGFEDVKRRQYVRWSILQHYEVCSTPLLDFTQSLITACSFAYLENNSAPAFVYVFAFPYVNNRISVNSEHDIVNVRLLSICPPEALRPYYQEGYLAATDELTWEYRNKNELDFNRRLIAKFELPEAKQFWKNGFSPLTRNQLYPKDDRMDEICLKLSLDVKQGSDVGRISAVQDELNQIENRVISSSRNLSKGSFPRSYGQALSALADQKIINDMQYSDLEKLQQHNFELSQAVKGIMTPELDRHLIDIAEVANRIMTPELDKHLKGITEVVNSIMTPELERHLKSMGELTNTGHLNYLD